ncbi:MAG: GNAT family N-acetyltransferase [Candidatus Thorarchaeota archaeon]
MRDRGSSTKNSPFPILETERLVLRQLTADDSEVWFQSLSDDEIAELVGMEPLKTIDEIREIIDSFTDRFNERAGMAWAITLKESNEFIGTCSYEKIDNQNHSGEIGYDLLKEYWGLGFMTEALRAIIDYGFVHLKLNRIEAHTASDNTASRNLLKRLGFYEEGTFRESSFYKGEFKDDSYYSLLTREWGKP